MVTYLVIYKTTKATYVPEKYAKLLTLKSYCTFYFKDSN